MGTLAKLLQVAQHFPGVSTAGKSIGQLRKELLAAFDRVDAQQPAAGSAMATRGQQQPQAKRSLRSQWECKPSLQYSMAEECQCTTCKVSWGYMYHRTTCQLTSRK